MHGLMSINSGRCTTLKIGIFLFIIKHFIPISHAWEIAGAGRLPR